MKGLYITNMFPFKEHKYYGIHVKEQIESLSSKLNYDIFFINAYERGKLEYIKSIFPIIKKIKSEKYDYIHIHYGISGIFLFFFRPKIKIFLTLHGGDILPKQNNYIQNIVSKLIISKVDKVLILNEEMEEIIKKYTSNYEILPCGVNSDFFTTDTKLKKGRKIFLIPGDPSRDVKDYALFKKVIFNLLEIYPELEEKHIHNLTRMGVKELLNKASCLIMTSKSEGSPQIIKEALSCGIPIVSTNVGDVKIVIDGIDNCYTSESRSANEISMLVVKSQNNVDPNVIRNQFLNKNKYDNIS
jgi:glycosyltransferase involved in cell wall biosynthesis